MIQIDGVTYAVPVVSLTRKAEFLDQYAERTESGDLQRGLIGVFFNYQLKLGVGADLDTYNAFWEKATEAEEFHTVTVPYGNGTFTFQAYFSNVQDELLLYTANGNYYKGMSINFIAKSPARTPGGGASE